MPYREPHHEAVCYLHLAAPATERCGRCGRPICEPCLGFDAALLSCPACVAEARARRRRGELGWWLALATLVGAAAAACSIVLSVKRSLYEEKRAAEDRWLLEQTFRPRDPNELICQPQRQLP